MVKLSKYCDQILIALMRIAPYSLLDEYININIVKTLWYLSNMYVKNYKLSLLHTVARMLTTKIFLKKVKNKINIDIKSLIYQLGCLQTVNPCIMGPVLSDYISTLFYIISKPELFTKPATIKYSLLSMKKIIK